MRKLLSTAADVVFVLLVAGGVAMIYVPAGFIVAGGLGLGFSYWRNR